MIAKARAISHGANSMRYVVNKDKADIIKLHLLPDNVAAESLWSRMLLHQAKFLGEHTKAIKNNMIRIEVSPTAEETKGWTNDDWEKLADDFIREFDSIDLTKGTKRAKDRHTNLCNSQYVVSLHRDSKSGILHLHIDANRIDNGGNINNDHNIHIRAMAAANNITKRRGWVQASDSNKEDILRQIKFLNQTLTEIRINLREKRGKLDQVNQELDSLKSTYNAKLKGLDAIMKKDNVMINYINRDADIILKASIFDQVLYEAVKICREIPEAEAMAEDTFIDDRNDFRWKDVLSTGLRVFIAGIDGATGVAQVSGGGGTSNDMPWRDKDEDFLDWARRAMRYAHAKHYPGNRFKRSLSK